MKMHVNVCKHVASAKSSTVKWNYRQWNAILAVFVSVCVCLQDTLYSMSLLDWTSGWLPQCHKDMWSLVHRLVKMLLISVFSCSCLQLCIDSKAHWVLVVKCQTTTAPYQKCFQNFRHSWEARTFQAVQICQTHQFILFPQRKQWKIGNILRPEFVQMELSVSIFGPFLYVLQCFHVFTELCTRKTWQWECLRETIQNQTLIP